MLFSKYLRELSANCIATKEGNITTFNKIIGELKAAAEAGHTSILFRDLDKDKYSDILDWVAMNEMDMIISGNGIEISWAPTLTQSGVQLY